LSPGRKTGEAGLPCNGRIPLLHTGATLPLCGNMPKRGGIFMEAFSICTAAYWRAAASELRKIRNLVLAALVVSFATIIGTFSIPVALNLHISFTFLFIAFGCMIYGPILGLFAGAAFDIIGYITHPFGAFFPGYTLSAMLSGLIYGLFLYRCRLSVLHIFLAKLIVNYGVNVLLGSLWSKILIGRAFLFFFINSLIKNTLMLPIEVVLLTITLQILLPVLVRAHLLPARYRRHISIL
jgi:ECF transporter S component (folate family)